MSPVVSPPRLMYPAAVSPDISEGESQFAEISNHKFCPGIPEFLRTGEGCHSNAPQASADGRLYTGNGVLEDQSTLCGAKLQALARESIDRRIRFALSDIGAGDDCLKAMQNSHAGQS